MDKLRLANRIGEAIDYTCQRKYDDGHRNHLGASLIGHDCSRSLWYVFRWVKQIKHSGQLLRLFNRGHKEEERIVEWLRDSGFEVEEFDEYELVRHDGTDELLYMTRGEIEESTEILDVVTGIAEFEKKAFNDGIIKPKKPAQFRISDCQGHFGGSLDGRCRLPEQLAREFNYHDWLLLEFKTSNDAQFKRLQKSNVQREKPQHFSQMSTYGLKKNYEYALYITVNKNTDELYIEIVKLDHDLGLDRLRRAEEIINSALPPQKLSQTPTHFKCKYCDFTDICHEGRIPDINCRSCKHAEPIPGGLWQCNNFNKVIPKDYLHIGCGHWMNIQG